LHKSAISADREPMRWLKHVIAPLLVLVAAGIVLATALSDHKADYGQVPLPQGGMIHLPKGKVTIYFSQVGNTDPINQVSVPLSFQVVSRRGDAVPMIGQNGAAPDGSVTRSETIGELGAVSQLDAPASGEYVVRASANLAPGSASLKFGTNAGAAILAKWKL